MNPAKGAAIGLLLAAAMAVASCSEATTEAKPEPSDSQSRDTEIISFAGTHGVAFGATRAALTSLGKLGAKEGNCSEVLAETTAAHPVFDRDRLVLMWAYPPLHTPEGVMVGTPMSKVREAYPAATALTPPPRTTTFPGLLVRDNKGAAYLILYDNEEVQKLIVGYEDAARTLYTTGFGTC